MAFRIDITAVGASEYPLFRVLHRTIFEPFDPPDRPDLEPALREEAILLLGHLEGNPLGFIAAIASEADVRIISCGVMKEYRRAGIAGRMLDWVETQAAARKLPIEMDLHPAHEEMARLLRKRGYREEAAGSSVRFERRPQ